MPSYESSMRNLARARARWRQPRPWRSSQEAQMIRRFVFQWLTCRDRSRPSGRAWARALGVSHTWLQKLVRRFEADAREMLREMRRYGDPSFAQLSRAREYTQRMKEDGQLRSSRAAKLSEFLALYRRWKCLTRTPAQATKINLVGSAKRRMYDDAHLGPQATMTSHITRSAPVHIRSPEGRRSASAVRRRLFHSFISAGNPPW